MEFFVVVCEKNDYFYWYIAGIWLYGIHITTFAVVEGGVTKGDQDIDDRHCRVRCRGHGVG